MRRRTLALSLALLVLTAGLPAIVTAGSVHAQQSPQAEANEDDWAPCRQVGDDSSIERIERAEIVLVMDRSKSLEKVDEDGSKRRNALQSIREQLTDLQTRLSKLLSNANEAKDDFDIDVALVAFSTEAETVTQFGSVSSNHPSDADIAEVVVNRSDTDYRPAIEQALEQFENSRNKGSDTTCRILIFFTDGILDPYATVSGRNVNSELEKEKAEKYVSDFLKRNLCSNDTNGYRYRMDKLEISTYVAVLAGSDFDLRVDDPHQKQLLLVSKQSFLALTGHDSSPLLDDVSAEDSGCESWSKNRAGKVINFDSIDDLAKELEDTLLNFELGVRQPSVSCATELDENTTDWIDGWPASLKVTGQSGKRLCEVRAPRDGLTTLTIHGINEAAGTEWGIDDGTGYIPSYKLQAGSPVFRFDILSEKLPEGAPFGGYEAMVEVKSIWIPDPQSGWSEQLPEVEEATRVNFLTPNREERYIDQLVDCRSSQRARRTTDGNYKVVASPLCEITPPPAGHFEVTYELSQNNNLSWEFTLDGRTPTDEPISLASGENSITLGVISKESRTIIDGRPKQFIDQISINLTWYSPGGVVLVEWLPKDIEIRVLDGGEYSPEADCRDSVDVQLEKMRRGLIAVAREACRIFPPPKGNLEVRITETIPDLQWQLARENEYKEENREPVLRVEPGGEPFEIDAILEQVPVELLPLKANVGVEVTWSEKSEPEDIQEIIVIIPDISPPQELLNCTETPKLVNSSGEVPSSPLVVNTGCTLLPHTLAGSVTASVEGDLDDTDWQIVEDIELVPGDDKHWILIETTDPLANRRYDTDSDFTLTATWESPSGNKPYVIQEPPRQVTVSLRARPDTPLAALITLLLVLAGLIIVWLTLWLVGRRVSRPARPGQYRVAHQGIKATVASGGRLELAGFDPAAAVADNKYPLSGRRSKLQAAGLEIRNTLRWWSPRDLLGGGRARAIPKDMGADSLLAVSPSSERSDCLPVSLDDGAVIVAIQRTSTGSKAGLSEHTGQIWILTRSGKGKGSTDQNARKNLDKVLVELRKALSESQSKFRGSPDAPAPNQPKG